MRACENCKKPLRWNGPNAKYCSDPICMRKKSCVNSRLVRHEAIMAYGGYKCVCEHGDELCGVTEPEWLTLDHIDGRNKMRGLSGAHLNSQLKTDGWPPGMRVLCYNCNSSRGHHGYCPLNDRERQRSAPEYLKRLAGGMDNQLSLFAEPRQLSLFLELERACNATENGHGLYRTK